MLFAFVALFAKSDSSAACAENIHKQSLLFKGLDILETKMSTLKHKVFFIAKKKESKISEQDSWMLSKRKKELFKEIKITLMYMKNLNFKLT